MEAVIDIQENKTNFMMKASQRFPFIKLELVPAPKSRALGELQEAVANMRLVHEGKMQARSARALLNAL